MAQNNSTLKNVAQRIRYIEPNYNGGVEMMGSTGNKCYEMAPALEDYCIFVNLKAEVYGRNMNANISSNNKTYVMNWISDSGKSNVSFLKGSEYPNASQNITGKGVNSFTTNYTDVFFNDITKVNSSKKVTGTTPNSELFGINSIDINYQNWSVPEITIKFIDIRGGSLFSTEESAHNKSVNGIGGYANNDIAGSFFRCFFTFPYPKFTLEVKGFYGQPVAYELTCSDFEASFNSATGNFEATAKFIGFAFSFLGDVMMNYLIAAPFSDYLGRDYWNQQVENGRFTVKDVNNNTVGMKTIGQIVAQFDSASEEASGITAQSDAAVELQKDSAQNEELNNFINAFNSYLSNVYTVANSKSESQQSKYNGFQLLIKGNGGSMVMFIPGTDSDDNFDDNSKEHFYSFWQNDEIKDSFDTLKNAAASYKSATGIDYTGKVEKYDIKELKPIRVFTKNSGNGNKITDKFKSEYKSNELIYKQIQNNLNSSLNGSYSVSKSMIDSENLYYAYSFNDNEISRLLSDDKKQNTDSINQNTELVNNELARALAQAMNFSPTVENITRIIMAHFETLTYMISTTCKSIASQNRTLSSLGISNSNIKDVSSDTEKIPPFPKVTQKVSSNGVETDEEAWVGDFNGDWLEKDLINGLLNGINEMQKLIASSETGSTTDSGTLSAIMKIPLSPLDMVLTKNPYGEIDFADKSSVAGHVAIRMFSLLGLNTNLSYSRDATLLGSAEAENFATFFPNPSQEFKQWLKCSTITNDIMSILLGVASVDSYGKNGRYAWESRNSDSHTKLMKNGTLVEFLGENQTFLPVQNASFNKIMSDLGSKKADGHFYYPKNNSDYIVTFSKPESQYGSSLLYTIEPNVNRFNTIAENQIKDTSNTKGVSKIHDELIQGCTYSASNYKRIIPDWDNDYIISYSDGEGETTAESVAKSTALSDSPKTYLKNFQGYSKSDFFANHDYRAMRLINVRCTSHYLESLDGSSNSHEESIFGSKFYYKSTQKERAVEFLLSLRENDTPMTAGYINYFQCYSQMLVNNSSYAIVPKAAPLLIGGLCYFSLNTKDRTTEGKTLITDNLLYNTIGTRWHPKIRHDVQNSLSNYFLKWFNTEFIRIDSAFSLKIDNCDEFFSADEDDFETFCPTAKNSYGAYRKVRYGYELIMRPDTSACELITKLTFEPIIFSKNADCLTISNEKALLKTNKAQTYINSFISSLKKIYSISDTSDSTSLNIKRAAECDTDKDIKIAIYRYLKILYDRWIAGSDFDKQFTMEKFFGTNPDSTSADDRYFYFIDSFYNKIGNKILINLGNFKDEIMNCELQDGYTLLSFLSTIYSKNKFNFLCVQNFMDMSDLDNMKTMFDPIPYIEMNTPDATPNFIVMYPYEMSNHLDLGEKGKDNGADYENDSFSISNLSDYSKMPLPLLSNDSSGYKIPAFGVAYGSQYQSYFKDVQVSMDSPMATEQAIRAQYQIAGMNNESSKATEGGTQADNSARAVVTMGQDLFTIYSNNSYTATINMMGCAWIQPLMYFELLNIPMFRGTYLIERVSHHLEPGNMTTNFTGVRMANTTTKLKQGWLWGSDPASGENTGPTPQNLAADVTNDCSYIIYPLCNGVDSDGTQNGNCMAMFSALKAGGLNELACAGALGNSWQECRWKWDKPQFAASWRTKGGVGMFQWTGPFRKSILSFSNNNYPSMKQQTAFAVKSLNGVNTNGTVAGPQHYTMWAKKMGMPKYSSKGGGVMDNFISNMNSYSSSIEKATAFWYAYYENPGSGDNTIQTRIEGAKKALTLWRQNGGSNVKFKNKNSSETTAILKEFISAVLQTSQITPSCGLAFGTERENGNSCRITRGSGDGSKMSVLFDILLNGYSAYIQELWWICKNSNDTGAPAYIDIKVAEKPNYSRIAVGMKANGSSSTIRQATANTNKAYRRAIVKFYSQNGRRTRGIYTINVKTKVPESDFTALKPTSCSEIVQEEGGTISAQGTIGNWNATKAASYALSHAANGSRGLCAKYTLDAIKAGGCNRITMPPTRHADLLHYRAIFSAKGWKIIAQGHSKTDLNAPLQKGDVCISSCYNGVSPSNANHGYHVCLYTGMQWVSDFKQGSSYTPYRNVKNWWIYRYSGSGM